MATGEDAEPLHALQQPQRAGFVELIFDVVLVFAGTRLTSRLLHALDWRGFWTTVLLLLALWWVWYRMAWTTNRYAPNRVAIQCMVIVTMFGVLLMAVAIPTAFTGGGLVFAAAYTGVQVLRHLWLVLLGGEPVVRQASTRILFWALISAVPWLAGGFADGDARLAWWSLAVGIDYTGGALYFPTPGLGRAGYLRGRRLAEEHLAERYRQVLIIAFGETILISGIQYQPHAFQLYPLLALLLAFLITIGFWQIYFYRAGELLPKAIAAARAPAYVSDLASYAHVVMIAGVGLSAVGDELVITHPLGHTEPAWLWAIFGGPAVFLVGRAILDYAVFGRISWSRPVGVLLLGALAVAALWLPPLLAATAVVLVIAVVAGSNLITWRWRPVAPVPPGRMWFGREGR